VILFVCYPCIIIVIVIYTSRLFDKHFTDDDVEFGNTLPPEEKVPVNFGEAGYEGGLAEENALVVDENGDLRRV
jgi:hypothetical protein